ncbi:hypothetical protein GCM10025868_06230 [Angustibacter aerolatus]|uniref:Uncharacterized protein n=1 Tax=Angustibacter aerolatus TaxID=1162965 RepID=A0ABQ6JB17_9ACTN|nr:hypothetical protein GCM10025868_06230 [Angustibacter aerolatus]
MPRGIGASVGVNDTVTGTPAAAVRFCSISGVCRCTPPTPYGDIEPMTSLASLRGLQAPARAGGAAGRDHHDVARLEQPGGEAGREGERDRRGVAARDGHPAGSGQDVALASATGQRRSGSP